MRILDQVTARPWTHWDTEQNEDGSVDRSFYRHDRHSITLTVNKHGKWSAISRLSRSPDGVLNWTETDLAPSLTIKLKEMFFYDD